MAGPAVHVSGAAGGRGRRARWAANGCALLLVFADGAAGPAAAAPVPPSWEYASEVQVARPGLTEIRVSNEMFDHSREGLADLRVFDPRGREIPWVLGRERAAAPVVRAPARPRWSVTSTATTAVFSTGDMREALPISRISVETPALQFLKAVTVEASDDAVRWRTLTADQPVFRQGFAERLAIDLPEVSSPWIRVRVDDTRYPPIPISGLRVHRLARGGEPRETIALLPKSVESASGGTRILLELPAAHLPVDGVTLEVRDPLFTRRVEVLGRHVRDGEVREQPLGGGVAYRVQVDGTEASAVTIPVSAPPPGRQLVLQVEDGDSRPLTITRVLLRVVPTSLRFVATEPGPHLVAFGNPVATLPRYDLQGLAGRVERLPALRATPGPVRRNPDWAPPEVLPGLSSAGRPIDGTGWRHRRPVLLGGPGINQIELPPEVLAQTGQGLGDVRLAAAGHQVPYVLDRAGLERELIPTLESLPPSEPSHLSRTLVRLPFGRLPLTRLSVSVGGGVFRRHVTLVEERRDERGSVSRVPVATALWESRGEPGPVLFTLPLSGQERAESLVLEVADGDNLPLSLRDARVFYRAARLIFKSGAGPGLELLYGNPAAAAPRYDIDLVAGEMLAAEAAVASLGAEAPAGPGRWWEIAAPGGAISWLFWGVLALVTAVLVAVILKLLPER